MKEDIVNKLKNAGFKVTPGRIAILGSFSADCKPMNAEQLYKKLKGGKMDLVTIYRTLNAFEEKGLLKRVDLRKGSAYYELENKHHHHHLVCTSCGKIESFEFCDVKDLSNDVLASSKNFNAITEHSLELFGICNSCLKS